MEAHRVAPLKAGCEDKFVPAEERTDSPLSRSVSPPASKTSTPTIASNTRKIRFLYYYRYSIKTPLSRSVSPATMADEKEKGKGKATNSDVPQSVDEALKNLQISDKGDEDSETSTTTPAGRNQSPPFPKLNEQTQYTRPPDMANLYQQLRQSAGVRMPYEEHTGGGPSKTPNPTCVVSRVNTMVNTLQHLPHITQGTTPTCV